ncbi:MAG: hypothetical protein WEG40_13155 [Candidatus Rokuibacteriota bacterium]
MFVREPRGSDGAASGAGQRDSQGLHVSQRFEKMGIRSSPLGEFVFEDVRLPITAILGSVGVAQRQKRVQRESGEGQKGDPQEGVALDLELTDDQCEESQLRTNDQELRKSDLVVRGRRLGLPHDSF